MHFSCWGSRPGSSIRPTRCRRRVFPEDELELFHVDVHPFFELFGGRKNAVRMVSSAPFDSGGLDVEMRDLPPAADFEAGAAARLEQLLVARGSVHRIAAGRCPGNHTVHQFELFDDGFMQHGLRNPGVAGFEQSDEIDDVDDPGCVSLCGKQTVGQSTIRRTRSKFFSWTLNFKFGRRPGDIGLGDAWGAMQNEGAIEILQVWGLLVRIQLEFSDSLGTGWILLEPGLAGGASPACEYLPRRRYPLKLMPALRACAI